MSDHITRPAFIKLTSSRAIDIAGQRFGRLLALGPIERKKDRVWWLCRCDCGEMARVPGKLLRNGNTRSCGCLKREINDLSGRRFGRWLVIEHAGRNSSRTTLWVCRCDCGTIKNVTSQNLLNGRSKSCGCFSRDSVTLRATKHGMYHHPSYRVWHSMITRCVYPNNASYSLYGARGITVCEEWRNDFGAFYDHVSRLPHWEEPGYSLDRIDNNGNYEPGNVRWATAGEQQRNRRGNHLVTYNGRTQCLADWADESHIAYHTLLGRIRKGWPMERALTEPVRRWPTSR